MLPPALARDCLGERHVNGRKGSAAGLRFNPVNAATACRQTPTSQRAPGSLILVDFPTQERAGPTTLCILVAPRLQPATRLLCPFGPRDRGAGSGEPPIVSGHGTRYAGSACMSP